MARLTVGMPETGALPQPGEREPVLARFGVGVGENDNRQSLCEWQQTYACRAGIAAFPEPLSPVAAASATPPPPLDAAPEQPARCPLPMPARRLTLASVASLLAHATLAAVLLAAAPALVMPAPEEEGATVVDVIMIGDMAEADTVAAVTEMPEPEPEPQPLPPEPPAPAPLPAPTLTLDSPLAPLPPEPPLLAVRPQSPAPAVSAPPPPPKPVEKPPEPPKPVETKPVVKPVVKPVEQRTPAPDKPKPVAEKPKPKPKKKKTEAAVAKPGTAQADRRKGADNGKAEKGQAVAGKARAGGSAEGSAAVANYPGKVQKRLRRVLKVPAEYRKGGATSLRITLTLSRSGAVTGAAIARSSGIPALDRAMLAAARAAGPFPPFPEGTAKASWTFAQDVKIGGRG